MIDGLIESCGKSKLSFFHFTREEKRVKYWGLIASNLLRTDAAKHATEDFFPFFIL